MPKCPKCGRAMASVLKREGDQVRTYYECPACEPGGEASEKSPERPPTKEEVRTDIVAPSG